MVQGGVRGERISSSLIIIPSATAAVLISFESQNSLTGEGHYLPSFALEEVQGTSEITAVAGWSQ